MFLSSFVFCFCHCFYFVFAQPSEPPVRGKVIRNPVNFNLWNPESTALESGIQLMGSGIQP